MSSKDFLNSLITMTVEELLSFLEKEGKVKEPKSYNISWDFIIPDDEDNNKTT